ncbi:MAG: Eco57I restriction-modification methylase domain-containing protein [Chloroflexota bacterium]|jgi:hypothetical protein
MPFNIAEARKQLHAFELKKLFIEQMGWDQARQTAEVEADGLRFPLTMVAQKRGFAAFVCPPLPDGSIPNFALRAKIETQARKLAHEHLIIFTDKDKTVQKWQWVRREPGKPIARREYEISKGKMGDALLHRLQALVFELEEEEDLTIIEVGQRVRKTFDVEKVTKKFYDRFKNEHAAFMKFIRGIPDEHLQRWYASVTLNRLMFIYFIQKKRFLDNDPDYLRRHLEESKKKGKDKFYAGFLCPLFFEGLAKRQRAPEYVKLLGVIPYLNGGIFERRQIEELHGEKIQIPDQAFERLFDFFDEYRWHLDERPNRNDNEINPDVLGYIFEKYINQKQMGAYYTKEDITEYIAKNTILPHLFDAAGVGDWRSRADFVGLLARDPNRYLYPAVRHGVIDEQGEIIPESALPDFVQTGMRDPNARMFDKRYNLQMAEAGDPLRLPTETWREYVYRRQRCLEVRAKLQRGEATSINDLITLNLDIRQFAQDVIQDSDADLLAAFWKALTQMKILDPTVGSGAFLFAALNVLEPLYEACLERMSALVEELDRSGEKHSPKKYEPFRKALAQVQKRPDEDYFIFKSIIINNLYGVDIMEEAVEICKLRLFLKLAAQVEPDASQENLGIEPLPDIDFNIRAGNTLVGFATREDVKRSVTMGIGSAGGKEKVQAEKLFALPEEDAQLKRIEEKAADVDRLYQLFRQQQTELGGEVRPDDKRELQKRLRELEAELNLLLARQYGISLTPSPSPSGRGKSAGQGQAAYQQWLESHKPFHWFVEFYGIMNDGGFDVIIGNPPYIELAVIKNYQTIGYSCKDAGNLYALVIERGATLGRKNSRQGYIVPVSSISTDRYEPLQKLLASKDLHFSSFDDRPSRLFDGLEHIRLTIHIISPKSETPTYFSTKYNKWVSEERNFLFQTLRYTSSTNLLFEGSLPKLTQDLEHGILDKVFSQKRRLAAYYKKHSTHKTFYSRKVGYFLQVLDFEPLVLDGKGKRRPPSEFKELPFDSDEQAQAVLCCLNSNLFYWFLTAFSDCRHLNKREIDNFPIDLERLVGENGKDLSSLAKKLSADLKKNSETRVMEFSHDKLTVQSILPKASKPIIDEIDRALARHYGLTEEELDFIINYDVKYRMGASAEEEE